MNVFVLCTGRCGSTTFIEACRHIRNFTAGHETRAGELGDARFAYPTAHIEADNRLAWVLGRLEEAYGDRAVYVHLTRDPEATAQSFLRRYGTGIIEAYASGILMGRSPSADRLAICRDYVQTVTANIEQFLRRQSSVLSVHLATIHEDFERFWAAIGAEGDRAAARATWQVRYNRSGAC